MRDWAGIRSRCEAGESLRSLAQEYGVPYSTVRGRAAREGWRAETEDGAAERDLDRIGRKLLRRIERELDGNETLDLRELKSMAGALRELQSLRGESGGSGSTVTVCFEGDAEEMSL